jgi:site-specific DNA recombinase
MQLGCTRVSRYLMQAIAVGEVHSVLAWAPERLHRSPRELEDFLELIEHHGVVVETVKAGTWDVSTSHGRLVARMLGAVSRAESERTGERVSRAHQQAKAQGRWRGPIPYGMRASDRPGLREPDPEQSAVVRDIYARVLRGDALTRIAADLTTAGVPPRRGAAWTHTGILRLVTSPALGGLVQVDNELRAAAFAGPQRR